MRVLIGRARENKEFLFLFVNNRLEGNAPTTILSLVEPYNRDMLYGTAMLLQIHEEDLASGIRLVELKGKLAMGRESQRVEALVDDLVGGGHCAPSST